MRILLLAILLLRRTLLLEAVLRTRMRFLKALRDRTDLLVDGCSAVSLALTDFDADRAGVDQENTVAKIRAILAQKVPERRNQAKQIWLLMTHLTFGSRKVAKVRFPYLIVS